MLGMGSTERQKAEGTRQKRGLCLARSGGLDLARRRDERRRHELEPVGVAMRPQAEVARSTGLEPVTPSFEGWCSIQLSYERKLGTRN